MTLFSIIKYPLSHPPTEEELSALPEEVFADWCYQVVANITRAASPRTVASIFRAFYRIENQDSYRQLRAHLIQILEKYEEPVE